jgi:hypothetical protein
MYAVVGCTDCGSLWLLSDPEGTETATCPGCGRRHRTDRLRRLYRSEDREDARQARAAMLADRADASEAFESLSSVAEMERDVEGFAAVTDRDYLQSGGVDPDEVAAVDADDGGSRDRATVVRDAVRAADPATEDAVVERATEDGVPASAARDLLDRLRRRGEVTESDGRLRLL